MITIGWSDVSSKDNPQQGSERLEFITFAEGSTIIRVVDKEPHSRWTHWMNSIKRTINCPGKGCPICNLIAEAKANKETPKYSSTKKHIMHVINRSSGKLELLDQGKTFMEQLLAFHQEVGDVRTYDIKVIRKGTTQNDTTYTLIPLPQKPLSEDDEKLLENKIDLIEWTKPPTFEQILDLLNGKDPKEVFSNKVDTQEDDEQIDFTK